ncbi:MAG: LacI family DNA-binding transcriptional regulator [Anaerolineae bacterium]|nr:LacI family DNA-binding transcriptional regulator [Anaerolineae bacterium]
MSATLRDVAKLAGVSVSTVSRVIRNERYVDEDTRQRVSDAIRRLQYRPYVVARQLKSGRTYAIGFIMHDISNPFFSTAVKGAEQYIRQLENPNYELILCNTGGDSEREGKSIELLLNRRVEGIIVSSNATVESIDTLRHVVEEHHIPVVSIDNHLGGFELGVVSIDHYAGAYQLARHLVEIHGHRRIGIITGALQESHARKRLQGFTDALAACGVGVAPELIGEGDWFAESSYAIVRRWLALDEPPTALFSSNNFMSIGALRALRDSGLRVPDDMALVTFDDVAFGDLLRPTLTTLEYSWEQFGAESVRLLLEAINGEGDGVYPRDILIPFRFLIRESCGCGERD